ncbi:heparin lyase I family protein [Chroococcidiopsis sp. FACHB-1243]|uniref:polysaccharide lyase n=1 Tax=Chroococcidiopsis sp. [FACHB-1243] TaxID=2692781 RepID=UPI00177DD312|nr:polysaccharide lyase [Chroococcidiopsis sp. [FACHB-1243]]MBD2305467.1 heparin lyase I family protein [Chroococcidiopsis sp. [FACHB-1243]]
MSQNKYKPYRKWLDFITLSSATTLLLVFMSVWLIPFSSKVNSDTLVFLSDFESGFSEWGAEFRYEYSAQLVNSPVRAGKQAVKFLLKKEDTRIDGVKRAELRLGEVPPDSEIWYGFSVFLPANYHQDPSSEIIAQWHDLPDKNLGETWKSPALSLSTKDGKFILNRKWDSKRVTVVPEGKEVVDLGLYQTGRWTDFVFHVKWSSGSNGLLKVWQDGKLVVRRNGLNNYNDARGPYLKIGIYKGDWKNHPEKSTVSERELYFDEVRVGDANARYTDIAPRD